MPQPTISQVHVDGPLTNLSVAFLSDMDGMLYPTSPRVTVGKKSDSYFTYTASAFRRTDAKVRGPGDPPPISGVGVSTATFTCERYSLGAKIPDPIRANADAPLNLDEQNMQFCTRGVALKVETIAVAALFGTGLGWGTGTQSNGTWDDANSTPIGDIKATARAMRKATGYRPNTLRIGAKVWDDLSEHPDIKDVIKYTGTAANPAMADLNALAQLFRVNRVIVLDASYDSAAEGAAASNAFLSDGESALLTYDNPAPGIMAPSAFYAFYWNEAGAGNELGLNIKRYRNPEREESDQIECNVWVNFKQVAASLGYYWNNAVAGTA